VKDGFSLRAIGRCVLGLCWVACSFVAQVVNSWQHVDVLALQSDSRMIVAGPDREGASCVFARLNVDGSVNASFAAIVRTADNASWVNSLALQSDGKIP